MKKKATTSIEMAFASAITIGTLAIALILLFNKINTQTIPSDNYQPKFLQHYKVVCSLPFCIALTTLQFNNSNCYTYENFLLVNETSYCSIPSSFSFPLSDLENTSNYVKNTHLLINYDSKSVYINDTESAIELGEFKSIHNISNIAFMLNYSDAYVFLPAYKKTIILYNASYLTLNINLTNNFLYYRTPTARNKIGINEVINSTLPFLCLENDHVLCFNGYYDYALYNNSYDLHLTIKGKENKFLYIVYENITTYSSLKIKYDKKEIIWQ